MVEHALKSSRNTIRGKVSEEIIPLLPDFPYKIEDCKFFGMPADYIIFDGMNEFRDGNKEKEISIIFTDIKYNTAVLSPVQKQIKKAIEEGRVSWETIKLNKDFKIK
jgi:predicted Holliday junction resolvase-like endonuclease